MYNREDITLAENQFVPKDSPEYAMFGDYELRTFDDFVDTPSPHEGILSVKKQKSVTDSRNL